ncbi:DinB family protein [Paenibacillus sedimenti]|uniref:DinB family protein n=1 Tax=Paenibacillus sedimenti TaxID=2770274 RepID=A0A926KMW6_9BACL|nr:DinB family protein [Paenibacillus sedimenti]MBD0380777.1 DinB family protein [Paenibacillus sedimenti]
MLQRPDRNEYAPYFSTYIDAVPDEDYDQFLRNQLDEVKDLFSQLSEEKGEGRYAPGKWSLKEVLGHMTDTERVMSYRMMRIARGDFTKLPGFDQDILIANGSFSEFTLKALLEDFVAVRKATFTLLGTIPDSAWERTGNVSERDVTARSLAYIIAGHAQHHLNVIQQRYL